MSHERGYPKMFGAHTSFEQDVLFATLESKE